MTSTMTSDFPPHDYMLTVLSERVKECLMENVSAEDIMDTIRSAAREHIRTSQESVKNSERLIKLVGERGTSYEDYRKAQVEAYSPYNDGWTKNTIRRLLIVTNCSKNLNKFVKRVDMNGHQDQKSMKTSNAIPKKTLKY